MTIPAIVQQNIQLAIWKDDNSIYVYQYVFMEVINKEITLTVFTNLNFLVRQFQRRENENQ